MRKQSQHKSFLYPCELLACRGLFIVRFTLVELLVVISVISVLVSMLLPALQTAKNTAKQIQCLNTLKQYGVASGLYESDNDGYALPSEWPYTAQAQAWMPRMLPYLGLDGNWAATKNLKYFACPENPLGYTSGNTHSYATYNALINYPIRKFKDPSGKAHMFDASYYACRIEDFYAQALLSFRHDRKSNVLFLDGHTKAYGYTALPYLQNDALARKWLDPAHESPAGL